MNNCEYLDKSNNCILNECMYRDFEDTPDRNKYPVCYKLNNRLDNEDNYKSVEMDKVILAINTFAKENLVTINIVFCWYSIRIEMLRDNYKQCIRISNKELETVNVDIVIKTALEDMLKELNKNY